MTGFFKRRGGLEGELRDALPLPSDALVSRIEARVRSQRPPLRRVSFRVALPVALTAAIAGALAAVGGVSYAATSVEHAVAAVTHVLVPSNPGGVVVVQSPSSGGDEYRPGFGYGDRNHNHDGPPGLKKKGGEFAPPVTPKLVGKAAIISTSFTIDEQAHLYIQVVDQTTGEELLITQTKSKVGNKLHGVQAKSLNYLVLVPRTIPITLAVPANLLVPGDKYAIRVIARDPDGNKSTVLLPFTS